MQRMVKAGWVVAALVIALCAGAGAAIQAPREALAEPAHTSLLRVPANAGLPATRNVTLGLNKSMVVELPREVRDVLVSDPKKLEAVVNTARRVYLIGMEVGQANAFFFDANGEQILTVEVRIEQDLSAVTRMLHRLMPAAKIKLEAVNDNVVVTGSVANAADAARATDLVSRMVEDREKVLNMLAVDAKEQVLLKVSVVEMERSAIKALGVNWDGNFQIGSGVLGFGVTPGFPINTAVASSLGNVVNPSSTGTIPFGNTIVGQNGVGGVFQNEDGAAVVNLRLLERNSLARTLAEPTLTAISGETANFLAGGEFPIPVSDDDGDIRIEFKPFGVGLAFTPVVLSEGRISMKVSTEVSELTNEGAIVLQSISIPALKVRRANSTIELPSGGSLVMAGLISDNTRQAISGTPGLKNLPVLGTLFRSRDFVRSETELVVIVTPFTVDPVARKKLARPDDGYANAGDLRGSLLGHMNRIYGRRPERAPKCCYQGDIGFIID